MDARRSRAQPLTSVSAGRLIAAGLVALAAAAAFGFGQLPGEMRDFEVYHTAASRALSGEPLYRVDDGHYQFKYLPAFAVLASPVGMLSMETAKALWFVISVALLAGLIALSLALVSRRQRPAWLLVVMTTLAMGKFYGHELGLGQVNLLFAVLVAAGILMMRRSGGAAAVLFVAAMVVKPYAILLLPWLAVRCGWRPAAVAAVCSGIVLGLPVVLYGGSGTIELHQAWWATVTGSTAPNLTNADNVSLAGFFAKWLGSGPLASVTTTAASLLLLGLLAFVVSRRTDVSRREVLEGALLLTAIPLLSPQGWDYVFLVSTPAIVLLVNFDRALPRAVRIAAWAAMLTIGLSLFDLMGRAHYSAFMAWSIITVCFAVVIAALALLRLQRAA